MIESISLPGVAEELRVVRSLILEAFPDLLFGISTRVGGASDRPYDLNLSFRVGDEEASVRTNRERFFRALGVGVDTLAMPTQVHGASVKIVRSPGLFEECDGLITNEREIFLTISVADCVPVFAFDPVRKAVAAIHAGWRGSRLGIVTKGLEMMASEYQTSPSDLRAVIGQSAGACCYEVGEEVAAEFEERFVVRVPGRKPRLDLHAHALDQLVRFGVVRDQIELLTNCTICHPEEFHSYRRERERSGRMMGVIGLRRRG